MLPLPPVFGAGGLILIGLGLAPIYPGLLHETPTRFGKGSAARLMGYQMAVAYTGTTAASAAVWTAGIAYRNGLFSNGCPGHVCSDADLCRDG